MNIIIVSGRSGSGKSITLHLLEDIEYYCIDNLPVSMLPTLASHLKNSYDKIAIGIDARNLPHDLDQFHHMLEKFYAAGNRCEIIYLDADDNTLIKRFSETRRKHPLSNQNISLAEAIEKEKRLLEPIAHMADLRVDTTNYTIYQLREILTSRINRENRSLSLLIQSFGYKFGVPSDSDYVFDIRCLPNPYWETELRHQTGLDLPVQEFLDKKPETEQMRRSLIDFLEMWIPQYEATNRTYMTISIGCTGGQHRSVYLAKLIYDHFSKTRKNVQMRHRELL
ncbi:MAG: RNase adapter RapZ [Legionellales bacterium]|nr:RNase adapter RapZ [Legionellales bacterium]